MGPLRTKLRPSGQLRLSPVMLLGLLGLGLLVVGVLIYAHRRLPTLSQIFARQPPEMLKTIELPEDLKPRSEPYKEHREPKPAPPVAHPVARLTPAVAPPVVAPPPVPPFLQPAAPVAKPPDFAELWKQQQETVAKTVQQTQPPAPGGVPAKPDKKTREPWIIKPTDIALKREGKKQGEKEGKELPPEQQQEAGRTGAASQLIQPARWAVPKYPLKTLYRSQRLAGTTLDAINSDIPGQVRIVLTVPVLDRFGYDREILPKGAIIIAKQNAGGAQYGQSRLQIAVEQLEFPTGEVVQLQSSVGDQNGANGVPGKVNNHLGKLVLATGISAILNIGVQAAAGTPGRGQFYENPAQSAAGEIGQDVQRTAKSVVDRELRVPPTITAAAGTFVTIALEENVQFSRQPLVVR